MKEKLSSLMLMNIQAGDVIVTNFFPYQHFSVVSDKIGGDGKPMLISATKRTGTVKEEMWNEVTSGNDTKLITSSSRLTAERKLANARLQINKWNYSVVSHNCEHFVNWVSGFKVTSKQVKRTMGGAIAGVAFVKVIGDKPSIAKCFLGAVIVAAACLIAFTESELS